MTPNRVRGVGFRASRRRSLGAVHAVGDRGQMVEDRGIGVEGVVDVQAGEEGGDPGQRVAGQVECAGIPVERLDPIGKCAQLRVATNSAEAATVATAR